MIDSSKKMHWFWVKFSGSLPRPAQFVRTEGAVHHFMYRPKGVMPARVGPYIGTAEQFWPSDDWPPCDDVRNKNDMTASRRN